MPSNVEIKARVQDFPSFLHLAKQVSGESGVELHQVDTFFVCPNGRLKLRCLRGDRKAQLVFYKRGDESGPKLSRYHITMTDDPDSLRETLGLAYGVGGEVRKKRTLFLVGQTRIHADEVDGLGTFMELEVVMKDGQNVEEGQMIAHDLMEKLGVKQSDLITGAYMDLLSASGK